MQVVGRVDLSGTFFAKTAGGERECALFSTPSQAGQNPRHYDVSEFLGMKVRVTCQELDASAAWGVTEVEVEFDG